MGKCQVKYIIVGGAGFIGSHFTDKLLQDPKNSVTIYDNFSSGRPWHYEHHLFAINQNLFCLPTSTAKTNLAFLRGIPTVESGWDLEALLIRKTKNASCYITEQWIR